MGIKRTTFFVEGMTCAACEARIGSALRKVDGVTDAKASLRGGSAWAEHDEDRASVDALKAAIERAGYVVKDRKSLAGTTIALGIGVLFVAAYVIASQAGIFSSLPTVDASIGYGMLFVVGLLSWCCCHWCLCLGSMRWAALERKQILALACRECRDEGVDI